MPRKNLTPSSAPAAVADLARQLGGNVAVARRRRRLRQLDLATKAGITRATLGRIEAGALGTALGAYLATLWALGLEGDVARLASPEADSEGVALAAARLGRRVRPVRQLSDDF
ncbi:MAG: XRE family transcriptional regulator [Myxococcota bacterium]|jgi:DNA-binding XRE family transcriptional regulator